MTDNTIALVLPTVPKPTLSLPDIREKVVRHHQHIEPVL